MGKGKLNFDMKTTCKKCGGTAFRLKSSKTWHHHSDYDYQKCGFVEVGKKYYLDIDRKLKKCVLE